MSETERPAPQRTDYETRMGEHYDPAGMDPVFGGTPCPATHPVTGRPCVYPEGHYEHHWAMGERRMQMFGPNLTCAPAPAGDSGGDEIGGDDCGDLLPGDESLPLARGSEDSSLYADIPGDSGGERG